MSQTLEFMCNSCETLSDVVSSMITKETFLTVISGVLIFVIGQLFNEYWLKPIQKYKELRAKISYFLCYYGNLYTNPIKSNEDKTGEWHNGSKKMRELSAEIRSMIELKQFGNIKRKKEQ